MLINQSVISSTPDKIDYVNIHNSTASISHQRIDIFEYLESMLRPSEERFSPLPRIAKITYLPGLRVETLYIKGVIC